MADDTPDPCAPEVLVERRPDGIAVVTLNRPARLNAMSRSLMRVLLAELEAVAADRAVRCVVLAGAGRAFCAGGDSSQLGRRPTTAEEAADWVAENTQQLRTVQRSTYLLLTMPKPAIARVQGYAVGGGLSLAMACDLRIAAADARLGTGYARVGLSDDFGSSYVLQRLVGTGKARELLFTGEMISGERAAELGLVTRAVPADALDQEAMGWAERLARGPTAALGKIKENLYIGMHADLETAMDRAASNVRLIGLTRDAQEGGRALAERREPRFQGA